ncbi:MAG: type 4a pilus biogenesis protein PilO [Deltaproteobacteria bacterium]|nr:type 4a pilus biogenesis protein PilO [Deltaproteobacteria bacterium]
MARRVGENCRAIGDRAKAVDAEVARRGEESLSYGPGPLEALARDAKAQALAVVAKQKTRALWLYAVDAAPELVPVIRAVAGGAEVPASLADCAEVRDELLGFRGSRASSADLLKRFGETAHRQAREVGSSLATLESRLYATSQLERELFTRVRAMAAEIESARREVETLSAPFAAEARFDEIKRELFLFAKRAGLTVVGVEPRPRSSDERFVADPATIRLRGAFHAFIEWLDLIARWNRPVVVKALNLTRAQQVGADAAASGDAIVVAYSHRRALGRESAVRPAILNPKFTPTSSLDVLQARREELIRLQTEYRRTTGLKTFVGHALAALSGLVSRRAHIEGLEVSGDRVRLRAAARDPLDLTRTLESLQASNEWTEATQLSEGFLKLGGTGVTIATFRARPVAPERPRPLPDRREVRDPFRTGPGEAESLPGTEGKPPLERYALADLRLGGVVSSPGVPAQAMIYDPTGKSHTARIGSSIGPNGVVGTIGIDHVIVVTREVVDGLTSWGRHRMDVKPVTR